MHGVAHWIVGPVLFFCARLLCSLLRNPQIEAREFPLIAIFTLNGFYSCVSTSAIA